MDSRRVQPAMPPRGTVGSDHAVGHPVDVAVDVAVAPLRAALGARAVPSVVVRGLRLAVDS